MYLCARHLAARQLAAEEGDTLSQADKSVSLESAGSEDGMTVSCDSFESNSCLSEAKSGTCHTNPKWKDQLLSNFKDLIILKCSENTRNAVEVNKIIEVCAEPPDILCTFSF